MNNYSKVLNIGFSMAGTIALSIILGIKLDEMLSTKVVFTILGTILGSFLSFYQLLRIGMDKNEKH